MKKNRREKEEFEWKDTQIGRVTDKSEWKIQKIGRVTGGI